MKTNLCLLGFASTLLCLPPFAHAATKTWNGSTSASWNTAANWTNNAVPVDGDDLLFPTGALNKTNNNNIPVVNLRSITFTDSGYAVSGNVLVLSGTNGITSSQASGSNSIAQSISLATNMAFTVTTAGASLGLGGNVTLNAFELTNSGSGFAHFSGSISGTGGFTKLGSGTNRFSGSGANLFSGGAAVSEGTLELNKSAGLNAVPTPLTIGDGSGAVNSAIVRLLSANQIADTFAVTIEDDGVLDLNGNSEAIGSLTVTGGDVTTGAGTLTLGGDVTANASTNTATISGNLSLGSATRSFSIADGTPSRDLTISAVISGSAGVGLIKTGAGILRLSGTNTYSGVTTVNSSYLEVNNPSALGSTSSGTTLSGGFLLLTGVTVAGETLTNTSSSSVLDSSGAAGCSGNVVLNATLFILITSGTNDLSGAIVGAGGLTKNGAGTFILSGPTANTYAGTTTVNAGTLLLNKTAGAAAITGALKIGDSTGAIDSAIVRLLGTNQVNDSSAVTIADDGLLDLNGNSDAIGSLTVTGGDVMTGAGTLTLGGDVTANVSTNTATISGNLSLGSATRSFSIADGATSPELTISAVISGNASVGIAKTGPGILRLSGTNTYSGVTTVDSGALDVLNPSALGSSSSGTTLSGTGLLALSGLTVTGETLTNASITSALNSVGAVGWSGNVVLDATLQINVISGTNDISGAISGAGGLTKNDTGTLILSGPTDNTYAGTTTVNTATLLLNKSASKVAIPGALIIGDGSGGADADVVRLLANEQITNRAAVTVNGSSGLLDLNDHFETIGSLNGGGNVTLGSGTVTLGLGNTIIATFSGIISGSGGLTKVGFLDQTLSGNNTYTGPTTINSDELFINGTQPSSAIVLVDGILEGTGRVGTITATGASMKSINPGTSPGILSSSDVALDTNTLFYVQLNGTNVGTDYDQLNVTGTVNLAGATLDGSAVSASLPLSNSFVIINNDGGEAVGGQFKGLANGSVFGLGGVPFRINYNAGDGNDVVVTRLRPASVITSATRLDASCFEITGVGIAGVGYLLEASTNLVNWTEIDSARAGSNGVYDLFDDEVQDFPIRFYRVLTP